MAEIKEPNKKVANELLIYLIRKWKVLFTVGLIAGVASLIVSFLLPVLYESTAIVYATATSTVSYSEQRNAKASAMDFGEDDQTERMIQILESSRIRDRIINKFDLASRFKLKPDENNFRFKLNKAYDKHINFERTRFGSIKISVLDRDPEMAAEIANTIVNLIDTVKNELIRERTIPAYDINKRKMDKLNKEQENLVAQIDSLAAKGVVTPEARANLFSLLGETRTPKEREEVQKIIEVNMRYGAQFDALTYLREFRTEKLTRQEMVYEQAESDAFEPFNHKFVIEWAEPADKKAKPKRLVVILVITLSTLFFTIVTMLISDRIKELKAMA